MKQIEDYKIILHDTKIRIMNAVVEEVKRIPLSFIILDGIDDLIEFSKLNLINVLFYSEYLYDSSFFYITEDMVAQELMKIGLREFDSQEKIIKLIGEMIDNHNDKVDKAGFEKPHECRIFGIFESNFIGIIDSDTWLDELDLETGTEALRNILIEKEELVFQVIEIEKRDHLKLLELLKTKILSDSEFIRSTNQRLRRNYIYSYANREENIYFKNLLLEENGVLTEVASNLVESLWRELKEHK